MSTDRLRNLGFGLAVTLVTLAALELGARLLVPPAIPTLAMYRAAAGVMYELRPGFTGRGPRGEAIRLNAFGLRGPEVPAKRAGVRRVLAVGDSFTFGLGVTEENSFPAALARALARTPGGAEVEVLNAGVPGYNLVQDTNFLYRWGDTFAADVVVIGFVENDLYNLDGSDFVATPDGLLAPRPGAFQTPVVLNPFAALSGPWLWLQLHSAAFRAASFAAIRARLAVRGDAELADLAARAERSPDLPARLLRGEDDADTRPRWAAAEEELRAAAEAAKRFGVPLVLVLFPRPEQLYAPRLRGGFARIAAIAEGIEITVVDPSPILAEDPDRIGLYLFPADHHPSPRGYARIAEVTARALVTRRLLDAPRGSQTRPPAKKATPPQ